MFRLRIQLSGVEPAIWRQLLVPGSVKLSKLATMLLAAMGWENSHMHAVRIGDERYGMHFDDRPDGEIDESSVSVLQALGEVRHFVLDYGFGDGWQHDVLVE